MRSFSNIVAAALIAMQALWSGGAAAATSAGVEEARLLCATLQQTREAQRALTELADIAGVAQPDEGPPAGVDPHECQACFAASTAFLAPGARVLPSASVVAIRCVVEPRGRAVVRGRRGAPLGPRAPPHA